MKIKNMPPILILFLFTLDSVFAQVANFTRPPLIDCESDHRHGIYPANISILYPKVNVTDGKAPASGQLPLTLSDEALALSINSVLSPGDKQEKIIFGYNFDKLDDSFNLGAPNDKMVILNQKVRDYFIKKVFPAYEKAFNLRFVPMDSQDPAQTPLYMVGVEGMDSRGKAFLIPFHRDYKHWNRVIFVQPGLTDRDLQYIAPHELEHVLGLLHSEGIVRPENDEVENTIMSYNNRFPDNYYLPTSYTPLSVHSLDLTVGPNPEFNAGNTVHEITGERFVGAIIDRKGINTLSGEGFSSNSIFRYLGEHDFIDVMVPWIHYPQKMDYFRDHCEIRLVPGFDFTKSHKGKSVIGASHVWISPGSHMDRAVGCLGSTVFEAHENSTLTSGSKEGVPNLFILGKGHTKIEGFDPKVDTLDLGNRLTSKMDISLQGNDTILNFPGGDKATLFSVTPQDLALRQPFCGTSPSAPTCPTFYSSGGSNAVAGAMVVGLPVATVLAVGAISGYLLYKIGKSVKNYFDRRHQNRQADLEAARPL